MFVESVTMYFGLLFVSFCAANKTKEPSNF